jgi:hypothetical protein
VRAGALAALIGLLAAVPSTAQEWYDAYQRGLDELSRGRVAQAGRLLESATRQRPQAGRDVLTYGTNSIPLYTPWLYLAEARLLAGEFDEAEVPASRRSSRVSVNAGCSG